MTKGGKRSAVYGVAMFFWLLVGLQGLHGNAGAYVVPPEQLLDFMAQHVTGFDTLSVTWERTAGTRGTDPDAVMEETVWFGYSGGIRVDRDSGVFDGATADPEFGFLELFSGRRTPVERFLVRSGVDVGMSAHDRVDRESAYRIGREGPGNPALYLEKARFVPLRLVYEPPDAGVGKTAEIHFLAYQKTGRGWFPHEIRYTAASGVTGIFRVKVVRPNAPYSTTGPSRTGVGVQGADPEESSRLERVMRAFDEKYGD